MSDLVEALKETHRHIEECSRIGVYTTAERGMKRSDDLVTAIIKDAAYLNLRSLTYDKSPPQCHYCGDYMLDGLPHYCKVVAP